MEKKELELFVEELERKATLAEDMVELINLQSLYNYHLEMNDTDYIVNEVFAQNDPEVSLEIGDTGIYVGLESIKKFWDARHKIQQMRGYLGCIMTDTPHIQVNKAGDHAKAIWYGFGPNSVPVDYPVRKSTGNRAEIVDTWLMGKYQNEYVKENGKWRIKKLQLLKYIQCPFDKSWNEAPDVYSYAPPKTECVPDLPGHPYTPYDPNGNVLCLPFVDAPRGLFYDK